MVAFFYTLIKWGSPTRKLNFRPAKNDSATAFAEKLVSSLSFCSGFIDRRAVPKTAALCCSALCSGDLCSAALCSLLVYDYALEDDDPLL
jgi:hypothetical protein